MNDKAIRAQQWPPQLYSIPILPSVFSVITSKSNCDVRLNSSLITPWTSPSGVFYSRSRTLSPCLLFGLPIWYAKPAGSTANLTSKGIAVYNHKGHRMWQRPEHNTIASVSCCLFGAVECGAAVSARYLPFLDGKGLGCPCFISYNSYCITINGKPECECPDHYSPFEHDNLTGCRPDIPLPSCNKDGWEQNKDLVDFKEYRNLN
ncbi:hypothetical protein JHK82_034857 [Glycine max]|nr:hypothetical protein JHK82_034857 [Glycine max]